MKGLTYIQVTEGRYKGKKGYILRSNGHVFTRIWLGIKSITVNADKRKYKIIKSKDAYSECNCMICKGAI